jgi:hypothetical protein
MAKVKVVSDSVKSNVTPADTGCSCSSDCCGSGAQMKSIPKAPYVAGLNITLLGVVPRVSTELAMRDTIGAWRVRWGFGRMSYTVAPGLYSVGKPDNNSPVMVTANYKLTFDSLRKELSGLNLWILVLDTKGVNVWCAAGKGTFGTDELVHRIEEVKLGEIVKHRTIIIPQLGATGVAAHEVAKRSGFHVQYGPVRASDVKAFLAAGMKAVPEMRAVKFTFINRAVLTPMELVQTIKPLMFLFGALFILNALGLSRFGSTEFIALIGAVVTGCVLTPMLLPWIPGRAFSFKGALLGLLWAMVLILLGGEFPHFGYLKSVSFVLLLPSVSAFLAMNFTGCSTYTSPSGVNKEMRIAIPVMLGSSIVGIIFLLTDSIIKAFH